MRNLISSLALTLLAFGGGGELFADSCTASVENVSGRLVGNVFYTQWRISHDAGRDVNATVYFEYSIHYLNKDKKPLTEFGVFNERMYPSAKQVTRENRGMSPLELISVDFRNVSCKR